MNTGSQPKGSRSDEILDFYSHLEASFPMPEGVAVMNPYVDPNAWSAVTLFYQRFYADAGPRRLIFGINPGRHGAGITGVPFTDPINLANVCAIANNFPKKHELSSIFIYDMIQAFGGVEQFYSRYFVTALSPLGFTWQGKNLNYYDDRVLLENVRPFIIDCIRKQIRMLDAGPVAWCLGEGTNYKFFEQLNAEHKFFEKIIPLPHPRWVMQYRRKTASAFINKYCESLLPG